MLDAGTLIVSLLAGVTGLVIIRYIQIRRPVRNYPPGPWGIPVFGSLIQFMRQQPYYRCFCRDLAKKYGDVFSVRIGQNNWVVLNGYDCIKEALITKRDDFSDKPFNYVVSQVNPKFLGLVPSRFGEAWFSQRQHAHRTLRGYGFGKSSFEGQIMTEVEALVEYFKDLEGKSFNVANYLSNCVVNIICHFTFGKRYSHFDDPAFLAAMTCIQNWFACLSQMTFHLGGILPIIRPLLIGYVREAKDCFGKLDEFVTSQIVEKKKQFVSSDEPGDFIESYLSEMEKDAEGKYNDEYLRFIVMDLFAAGMETVVTTLSWALLHMVLNPDVQEKVHKELDEVIGKGRRPKWADRSDLPYTEATLREVQRIGAVIPIMPHATTRQTTLRGYTIPKGTRVFMNFWSIHHDSNIYPEPDKFNPRRFLTEDGKLDKGSSYMPFGAGSRSCMGESLAKLELFLFFSTMLQQFSFSVPEGSPLPSAQGVYNFTNMPKPFELVVQTRF